jgi:hypothetical protein
MTRRERLENKVAKAEERSTASFDRAYELTANIPFGQPILVGHYSEGRHRRTLERSDNTIRHLRLEFLAMVYQNLVTPGAAQSQSTVSAGLQIGLGTKSAAALNSGDAVLGNPGGTEGMGTLQQGYLENSNVDIVTEFVQMVLAQRPFVPAPVALPCVPPPAKKPAAKTRKPAGVWQSFAGLKATRKSHSRKSLITGEV